MKLRVEFFSPRGFIIDTFEIPIGSPCGGPVEPPAGVLDRVSLSRRKDAVSARTGSIEWIFDRRNGMIRSGRISGRRVVVGGPILTILPLKSGEGQISGDPIVSLRPLCDEWRAESVVARKTAAGAEFSVEGLYRQAKGTFLMRVDSAGRLRVRYRFTLRSAVNPHQMGITMAVSGACDILSWQRRSLWSLYPPDHIGRPDGQARSRRASAWPSIDPRTPPPWPWAQDENEQGTNDFRATRSHIFSYTLADPDGFGVTLRSDGRQAGRACLDGDRILLLAADYTNGGGEPFMANHHQAERRPLLEGSVLEGTVWFELFGPKP